MGAFSSSPATGRRTRNAWSGSSANASSSAFFSFSGDVSSGGGVVFRTHRATTHAGAAEAGGEDPNAAASSRARRTVSRDPPRSEGNGREGTDEEDGKRGRKTASGAKNERIRCTCAGATRRIRPFCPHAVGVGRIRHEMIARGDGEPRRASRVPVPWFGSLRLPFSSAYVRLRDRYIGCVGSGFGRRGSAPNALGRGGRWARSLRETGVGRARGRDREGSDAPRTHVQLQAGFDRVIEADLRRDRGARGQGRGAARSGARAASASRGAKNRASPRAVPKPGGGGGGRARRGRDPRAPRTGFLYRLNDSSASAIRSLALILGMVAEPEARWPTRATSRARGARLECAQMIALSGSYRGTR